MPLTPSELFKRILNGDEAVIQQLYQEHGYAFVKWASHQFQIDEEDAKDIFQDCVITFYRKVMQGELTSLDSKVKTYLFGIGKHKILNLKRTKHHQTLPTDQLHLADDQASEVEAKLDRESRQQQIAQLWKMIEEPCLSILKFFYLYTYSYEVIAERLNYKNANVVKTQKARCLEQVRLKLGLKG